jgi:hypothetical protein
MSTSNIVSVEPIPEEFAVRVTFQTRRGTRTYQYTGASVAAIIMGEDPIGYGGELVEVKEG